MDEKTNVMRILDQKKVKYIPHTYETQIAASGTEAADIIGVERQRVFKTLVTVGKTANHYVFVIPVVFPFLAEHGVFVVGMENIGDAHIIGAGHAIAAAGAAHGNAGQIGFFQFLNEGLVLFRQAAHGEVFENGNVVIQLLPVAHAVQDGGHFGIIGDVGEGPFHGALFHIMAVHQCLHIGRRIGQGTAPEGFHDHDGHACLAGGNEPGFGGLLVIIQIIELNLGHAPLIPVTQNVQEGFGAVMEGKTGVADTAVREGFLEELFIVEGLHFSKLPLFRACRM